MKSNERINRNKIPFQSFLITLPVLSLLTFTLFSAPDCQQVKSSSSGFSISFEPIPYEDDDLIAPGRGAEQWHDQNSVRIPNDSAATKRLDKYFRFSWKDVEKGKGIYDWTAFDREINDAIKNRQKFAFGIMSAYPGGASELKAGEAILFYPLYLHEQMQTEEVKDWISPLSKMWVPNWNSEYYLSAVERLNEAINNHLDTGSFSGIKYKHIINYIDIRSYGSWGEWHSHEIVEKMSEYPPGAKATTQSLVKIIDAYVNKFSDYQLVIMFNVFDGNRLHNTLTPPEVGYYALTAKNKKGLIGWRRDNWGALDNYISQYTDHNTIEFNGTRFDTAIMNRYKYAPVNGEPIPGGSFINGCDYGDIENQVKRYHASSFGNGNFSDYSQACMQENIRAASKAAGYRLILEGGDISPMMNRGDSFFVMLQWKNVGIAPTYEDWDVFFELKDNADKIAWSGKSQFNPKLFVPEPVGRAITDQFNLPSSILPGSYTLNLIIKDPFEYRSPLPLAIKGRNHDGSYTLQNIVITDKQKSRTSKK
jgi:hypothetical protein